MNFLFVALGGAVGAVLRYIISLIPIKTQFPILTLITNILGALIIGFITGYAARKSLSQNTMLFLKTGLCGGFTTFSTFSLEAYTLFENGNHLTAVVYAVMSATFCILGVWVAMIFADYVVKS